MFRQCGSTLVLVLVVYFVSLLVLFHILDLKNVQILATFELRRSGDTGAKAVFELVEKEVIVIDSNEDHKPSVAEDTNRQPSGEELKLYEKKKQKVRDFMESRPVYSNKRRRVYLREKQYCGGAIKILQSGSVALRRMVLNKKRITGKRLNWEQEWPPANASSSKTRLLPGTFIMIECLIAGGVHYGLRQNLHPQLEPWVDALSSDVKHLGTKYAPYIPCYIPVLLMKRYEYANVFWTIVDLYNAFTTGVELAQNEQLLDKMRVVFLNSHPAGHLDELWLKMFMRVEDFTSRFLEDQTLLCISVWVPPRSQSWVVTRKTSVKPPHFKAFRKRLLERFDIRHNVHNVTCNRRLNLTVVWRRDYDAYKGFPRKSVSRKIENEEEIASYISENLPQFNLNALQLDELNVTEQLRIVSQTDILFGMHGAALAYTVVQAPGAALVELFPAYASRNWHYEYLALWSDVHYIQWKNDQDSLELPRKNSTIVPTSVVETLLTRAQTYVCDKKELLNKT